VRYVRRNATGLYAARKTRIFRAVDVVARQPSKPARDRIRGSRRRQELMVETSRQPRDSQHLRFEQPRALGLNVSDEITFSYRCHHQQLHQAGNEVTWSGKL